MNYIRLQNLTNTYPKPGNYIPYLRGDGALFGIYADVNKIDFKFADFSEVIPIDGISTRFIFAVTYDKSLSQIIDSDENIVDSKSDVNNTQKSTDVSTDTKLDKFINESNSSKRKKRKGFLGRIAKAAVNFVAGDLINSVKNTKDAIASTGDAISALSFGIRRKEIRKNRKSKTVNNDEPKVTSSVKPATNALTGELTQPKGGIFGRANQKRDRIFGDDFSKVENSTSLLPKPELIGDDNKPKLRIFSDLKVINKEDVETKLFCSQQYLEELTDSKNSANPYFVNFSFKPEFIVEINSVPLIELMDSFLDLELDGGVLMKRNNYIVDGNIDYEKLVQYVNWVVSKPSLSEIDTNGVIPANLLCEYEKGTFDKKTGKWDISVIQKSNTTVIDTPPPPTNNATFPPIGRAGTFTGEIIDLDGDSYAWTGDIWRPTKPTNRNGNNTSSGGSGGASGGSNYGGGDDGRDRRGMR